MMNKTKWVQDIQAAGEAAASHTPGKSERRRWKQSARIVRRPVRSLFYAQTGIPSEEPLIFAPATPIEHLAGTHSREGFRIKTEHLEFVVEAEEIIFHIVEQIGLTYEFSGIEVVGQFLGTGNSF